MRGHIDFDSKPYYLNAEQKEWVEKTFSAMSQRQKIGQLFCISMGIDEPQALRRIIRQYQPGGFCVRPNYTKIVLPSVNLMQQASEIPMLIAANLESGGNGIAAEGLFYGRSIEVAATDDPIYAYYLGHVCAKQAGALGGNWTFAPVVDIDMNWRNPITNCRTFGDDPDRVICMAKAYRKGVLDSRVGMAVCIKHFPGDGVDERDQHLTPTVNSLSADAWERTYGRVYQELIDDGAETLMVGHILQPEMTRKLCPDIADENIEVSTYNRYLITDLLRKKMGFHGLITTDSTNMVGYMATKPRAEALVDSICAGIDVLLFCRDIEEDFSTVASAVEKGVISQERLDEAVLRQLALKAHLNLHHQSPKTLDEADAIMNEPIFRQWAAECADRAITLVKDNQNLLPISPKKTPVIRLTVLGERETVGAFGDVGAVTESLKRELEAAGFSVHIYDYKTLENCEIASDGIAAMKEKFDLSIVAANIPTGSNYTTRRLDWVPFLAADCPWYVKDIPTMFISFCNPHHMADASHISTFINAYTANDFCVRACVEKMIGKSSFTGINPTDVWCDNLWGARHY